MPKSSTAAELAEACVAARRERHRASRVLHDEVGSLLAVAGLRLQLLQMDYPDATEATAELAAALDGAMQHIRKLIKELDPSPIARTGLQNALIDLANRYRDGFGVDVQVKYTATARAEVDVAEGMYLASADVVGVAAFTPGVKRIRIAVSGAAMPVVRISFGGNPRGVRAQLAAVELLAHYGGLSLDVTRYNCCYSLCLATSCWSTIIRSFETVFVRS
jgi:signal transduction histidine kinase